MSELLIYSKHDGWRPISEMIGGPHRTTTYMNRVSSSLKPTRDTGTSDYAFYDRAWRGKAKGLEISGMLIKPLCSKIASWVWGRPPKIKYENDATTEAIAKWWAENQADIIQAYDDSLKLADNYLVVNPDTTLTTIPPNVIRPVVNEADFSELTGWEIEEVYPHPTQPTRSQTIRDTYTGAGRIRSISTDNRRPVIQTFPNLIEQEVPVIHIANNVGANEIFGHPEAESMTIMLQRYGEIFDAAMEGNIRQGRPTPVISALGTQQEMDAFWNQYGKTETITLSDGTTETNTYLEFDADKVVTLGGNAQFQWVAPGSFTADTSQLLQLLFYLYVQHSEVPEWVLGNAIASSMASAKTQVEPFVKFIERKQLSALKWVRQLIRVTLLYMSLSEPGLRASIGETPEITFEPLSDQDGTLVLEAIRLGLEQDLLTPETALALMPLTVENPAEEVKKAQELKKERMEEFEALNQARIQQAEQRAGEQPPPQEQE